MDHRLKIKREYFKELISERKNFEVRKNDRDFKVGDFLELHEIDEDGKETTRLALVAVNYILDNPEYCKEGYVIMSISLVRIAFRKDLEIRKGKWIFQERDHKTVCASCGFGEWKGFMPTPEEAHEWMRYCPNCGRIMEG